MDTSLILNGYKSKVETPDELLARILVAAACIKKREDQFRRKTRDREWYFRLFTLDCNIICHLSATRFLIKH
jgi:hypothetical protein